MTLIIVDSAEKPTVKVERYLHADGVKTKREMLSFNGVECGDYTDEDYNWLVERKAWKDYIGSVTDGSLDAQMKKMCVNFDGFKAVVFEGDWDAAMSSISNKGIRALCETIPDRAVYQYGIAFHKCYDACEMSEYLQWLCKYHGSITKEGKIADPPHLSKLYDERYRPLMVVNGISETGSKALVKEYGSIFKVIKACAENPKKVISDVYGVGKTSVTRIVELFTGSKPIYSKKTVKYMGKSKRQKKSASAKRKKGFAIQKQRYVNGSRKNTQKNWKQSN